MKQLDFLKKTILCCIVCLFTMNANAQGNYLLATGDTPTSGQVVTSVSNMIMTYGEDTYIAAKSYKNGSDEDFTNYTSGAASPKVIDLIPTSGTYYKFVPTIAGILTIGVVQNAVTSTKSGAVVVLEDGTDLALAQQNASAKYYGAYSFTVKANSIYYVYIAGSKMGFYGFKFAAVGPSNDITNLSSASVYDNNPVYNLSGQRLSKKARGICIQKGKKYIIK
jgi:hypothetical protein